METLAKKNKFDFILLITSIVATIYGLVIIISVVSEFDDPMRFILMQSLALVLGLLLTAGIIFIDYESFGMWAYIIFGGMIFLLTLTLLIGVGEEVGTTGWIRFGPFGFQPAEIAKIAFAITFAQHASLVKADINHPRNILLLLLHVAIPMGLVLLQPDFGTAMVFAVIAIGVLYFAEISIKYMIAAVISGAIISPLMWFFVLQPHQKSRISVFLNPELDPTVRGYNVIQSKIAIGSGQVTGKGLFPDATTHIPAKQTDFIFAAAGEALGFIGVISIFVLLLLIIVRIMVVAQNARDSFGELLCVAVAFMFTFHVFESICMCIGLMPVTGIPLPFFSYGGSNLVTSFMAIALVLNVSMRPKFRN